MKFLIPIILLCILTPSRGQLPVFSPVELSRSYEINQIAQDKYGFLWMATEQGLIIYNGFEEYLALDMDSPCHSIYFDSDRLYAGYAGGMCKIIDVETRELVDSVKFNTVSYVSELLAFDNRMYASTYGGGLFLMENDYTWSVPDLAFRSDFIYDMAQSGDDHLAIATDRGLYIYNKNTNALKTVDDLPDVIITNILSTSGNLVWGSTFKEHIFSHDITAGETTIYPLPASFKVTDLIMVDSTIVVSGDQGLLYLAPNGSWKNYFSNELPENGFSDLFVDQENNLWVANSDTWLWKASLYFKTLPIDEPDDIQALERTGTHLVLGTRTALLQYDLATGDMHHILTRNITCVDKSGPYLVAGSYTSGVFVLKGDRVVAHFHEQNSPINNSILDISVDTKNIVYISSLTGIYTFRLEPQITTPEKWPHDLGYSYILSITHVGDSIFFARDKAGMTLFTNGTLQSYEYISPDSLRTGSIYSITQAADGSVWVAAENGGLSLLKGDSLLNIDRFLPREEAYTSIIPLHNNHLLLVRASGIDLFDVDRLHMMQFDKEAGIRPEEAFLNNFATNGDEVWFVHHNTIYQFDLPESEIKIHPTTRIDEIEVNLENISPRRKEFKQKENNFKFSFTGGWLTDPAKLSYAYSLEGFDNAWRQTRDRSISYPRLPPGEYTFRVKAAENDFFSDEPMATFRFKIQRAFYNSLWFYIGLVICLGLLTFALIRRDQREKALKAQLEQKQTETKLINLKSQLNPHFLFNSFNTLSGLVEENPEKGISYIESITDFYRHILETGDDKLIPLSRELEIVRLYEKLMYERFGKGFSIDITIGNKEYLIPPMTIQMLVENAIKHNQVSVKNPLVIKITQKNGHIEVANKKILKNTRVLSTGLGLNNIRDRYRLLGLGEVRVINKEDIYKIILPLKSMNHEGHHSGR